VCRLSHVRWSARVPWQDDGLCTGGELRCGIKMAEDALSAGLCGRIVNVSSARARRVMPRDARARDTSTEEATHGDRGEVLRAADVLCGWWWCVPWMRLYRLQSAPAPGVPSD